MQLRIFIEPQQGASYAAQLAVARISEDLGFEGFFRSDHYLSMGAVSGLPGPTDSWLTLAAIARETSSIRIGTLMSAATLRPPGVLALQVAQVDEMSGGRVELGLGTGWYEAEHRAVGLPFPARRFDILEEQLRIITGLWTTPAGELFDFAGEHHTLSGNPALPRPVQRPHPPLLVGGKGPRRTPALAARYADEYNIGFVRAEEARLQYQRTRAACEAIGRDPEELCYSVALPVCAATTEAQLADRADRLGRGVAELRATGLAGSPAELVDRIGEYARAGAQRLYLQLLDLEDWDQLELLAHHVMPQVFAE
ncbi:F420-dependent oxidoreductase-like protein [Kitasatospora sp. GAS204A]|uniref:LLM class F420-dependent oxidoreductase n=1 Tax=unclassified Kitasatospora TaxID=2633591 RepID=UPI0024741736|nr:LLM class F420-dependent oxidoreductase [Kitasatospora sp. GAS204B]MDH6118593.1 F420-dependent oxidoreductase-like protein [Kitasatospora sp. GAS204B]